MKRSTTRWTSTLAAVVLLGMPAAGWAQAGTASGQQPPTTTRPAQPPATTPNAPQTATAGQVDTEAARRHLTGARETLSEMTQLPAAATLTGDTRTHVTALISNFNELITNTTDWRSSHAKVDANLTSLLGPEDSMAPPAATPPATGTAGAVGTSGTQTETLDPALRGKLSELRAKLKEFERAMGGGAATAGGAATMDAPAAATTTGATSGSVTGSTTTPPAGSTSAPPAADQHAMHTAASGHAEALQHVAAIEAILNSSAPAATGTAGTAATATAPSATGGQPLTLSRTQVEELRTHLAALKSAIEKK